MSTLTRTPATAAELLDLLREFGPVAEAGALSFDCDPPDDLVPLIRILQSGIRAALAGRRWFGCGTTGKTAAPRILEPGRRIPPNVWLLAAEGDDRWDRIRPDARIRHARLFESTR